MAEPPRKKRKAGIRDRFVAPLSPSSMERVCKGYVPKNTTKATDWALRVFEQWKENRNYTSPEERVPEKLLEDGNAELLNLWLARFVVEIRRADGEPYPPSSINSILSGLYRYCKACAPTGSPPPNFMDRKNPHFRDLTGALQVKCRELREKGVGALVKHAAVITPDEEERFWETKVLGVHSPVALQRAVFFYVGKVFCLRRGEEQRGLKPSQFVRSGNPDCYTYVQNGSKNYSGVHQNVGNKVVPVYASPEKRPRCLVFLLDLYFSKFPPKGLEMDIFYLRPKQNANSDVPWYECAAVGKHKLNTFMESICLDAGVSKKTNHSLRATGTTALFNAGVPEKNIRDVTAHRSNSLHLYERPTEQQMKEVSGVLMNGSTSNKENAVASTASNSASNSPTLAVEQQAHSSASICSSIFSGLSNCKV